jgi:mannose-6-phosphate isomerase-like protein (cupin superfamily)
MKAKHYLAAAAILALSVPASAQFLGKEDNAVTANKMPGVYLAPKPTTMTPYTAPNRPHWKISDVHAMHKGEASFVQPIIRNKDQEADYISMAPGEKTKMKMWPDDRIVFIVREGAIKVSIEGYAPFTATKGFMVNVPFRHMYTLESVGTVPALRFEVRQVGSTPIYPADGTPDPVKGMEYVKVIEQPGPAKEKDSNPIYVDYDKEFLGTDKAYGGKFVWDDHFTSNILRGVLDGDGRLDRHQDRGRSLLQDGAGRHHHGCAGPLAPCRQRSERAVVHPHSVQSASADSAQLRSAGPLTGP